MYPRTFQYKHIQINTVPIPFACTQISAKLHVRSQIWGIPVCSNPWLHGKWKSVHPKVPYLPYLHDLEWHLRVSQCYLHANISKSIVLGSQFNGLGSYQNRPYDHVFWMFQHTQISSYADLENQCVGVSQIQFVCPMYLLFM